MIAYHLNNAALLPSQRSVDWFYIEVACNLFPYCCRIINSAW